MSDIINLIFIFGAEYLYLIIMGISFIWFLAQAKPKQKEIFIIACFCLPIVLIAFKIASSLYYNPRPFVLGHFQPLIDHNPNNGFPSHHMLLVSFIPAIVFLFDRRFSFLLWVLALFVGFSRVYVGVHHTVDIFGSLVISAISVASGYFLLRYLKKRKLWIFKER